MSISATNTSITITIPTIPSLTTYPLTVEIPTSYLRTLVRLVVIIATYLLFRPHIERLFRQMTGGDENARPSLQGMRSKIRELETVQGAPVGGGRKVAIVTGTGGAAAAGAGQTPKARRKA